jgi:hypothetical protein
MDELCGTPFDGGPGDCGGGFDEEFMAFMEGARQARQAQRDYEDAQRRAETAAAGTSKDYKSSKEKQAAAADLAAQIPPDVKRAMQGSIDDSNSPSTFCGPSFECDSKGGFHEASGSSDRFLAQAEIIQLQGKSYRLHQRAERAARTGSAQA